MAALQEYLPLLFPTLLSGTGLFIGAGRAERRMAGVFPLTEWQMSDGHIVKECEGRDDDPRTVLY